MSEKLCELKKKGGDSGNTDIPFVVAHNVGSHLYFETGDGGVTDGYGGYISYNDNFNFSGTIPNIGTLKWNAGTLRIVPTKAIKAYILISTIGGSSLQQLIPRTVQNLTANTNNDISLANGNIAHILFE